MRRTRRRGAVSGRGCRGGGRTSEEERPVADGTGGGQIKN